MTNFQDRGTVGGRNRNLALLVGAGLLTAGTIAVLRRTRVSHFPGFADSAPGRSSRQDRYGDYAVTGRSVTINRPRKEIYDFWRNFSNLSKFMSNVADVQTDGDLLIWKIVAPAGRTVEVRTQIVSDRENEEIAWRSVEGSDIDTEGKVMFRDAPAGRGTVVEAVVAYVPPAGELGRLVAKLFQREPSVQGRRELKRLKMLMETGEIATSQNRRAT